MSSNIPASGQPTVPVAQAPDSKHAPIAGAPATNDPAQSSTASALTDSLVGTSRMHEPPRGVGKNAHPGYGPPAGVTLGNIAPSSGIAPGKGSKDIPIQGPPADAPPAVSSTASALQASMLGTKHMHQPVKRP